jgi:hypothetical protein
VALTASQAHGLKTHDDQAVRLAISGGRDRRRSGDLRFSGSPDQAEICAVRIADPVGKVVSAEGLRRVGAEQLGLEPRRRPAPVASSEQNSFSAPRAEGTLIAVEPPAGFDVDQRPPAHTARPRSGRRRRTSPPWRTEATRESKRPGQAPPRTARNAASRRRSSRSGGSCRPRAQEGASSAPPTEVAPGQHLPAAHDSVGNAFLQPRCQALGGSIAAKPLSAPSAAPRR